jgi:hypothetical protein
MAVAVPGATSIAGATPQASTSAFSRKRRGFGSAGGVGRTQREAVHGRPVEGRRIGESNNALRHHAAEACCQRHRLSRQRPQVERGVEAPHGLLGGDDVEELLLPGGTADAIQQIGGGTVVRVGHAGS